MVATSKSKPSHSCGALSKHRIPLAILNETATRYGVVLQSSCPDRLSSSLFQFPSPLRNHDRGCLQPIPSRKGNSHDFASAAHDRYTAFGISDH